MVVYDYEDDERSPTSVNLAMAVVEAVVLSSDKRELTLESILTARAFCQDLVQPILTYGKVLRKLLAALTACMFSQVETTLQYSGKV